jgi:hypothetical protein
MSCQDVCLYEDAEMRALADALGAVAVGPAAIFWLYADSDGQWCVRRDGEAEDRQFHTRDEALNFVRVSAARCSSHRLVLKAPQRRGSGKDLASLSRQPLPTGECHKSSRGWRRRLSGWLSAITSHAGSA